MSTLTLRLVKGSALTYQEADDNFSNLNSDKLENVVEDTTPQLGGNLDVNGNSIVSVSNGDINLTPNGTGLVKVGTNLQIQAQGDLRLADGDSSNYVALQAPSTVASNVTWTLPNADGTANQVLKTDGSGALGWAAQGLTDIVQDTTPQLGGNLDVNGNSIVSASNGNISITPNGTGSIVLDGQNWPQADGTANQFLKTNGSGQLSYATIIQANGNELENVVEDTTPQLGGNLDVNGNSIVSTSNGNITLAPNGTGKVVISGDLQVDGTTTTINSTTLDVDDINITIAKGAANAAAANGGGITLEGPTTAATITYASADDSWNFNKLTKFTGNVSVAGDIVSPTGQDVSISPDGTNNVNLNADTVRIGDNNADATITTHGTGDLILNTNAGTSSGVVRIYDGANGNIEVTPNGTGNLVLDGLNWPQADGAANYVLKTNGAGQLSWVAQTVDTNTTYAISAETATGGVNLRLTGSDAVTDDVKFAEGTNITLTRTDANTITIASSAGGMTSFTLAGDSGASQTIENGNTLTIAGGTNITSVASATDTLTLNLDSTLTGLTAITSTTVNTDAIVGVGVNGAITITPNGTGDVQLVADTVQVGDANVNATITTNGTGDLILNTNAGTNSGSITILDGANANIEVTPNGTGKINLDGLLWPNADGTNGQVLTTNGTGTLSFTTVSGGLANVVEDTSPQLGGDLDVLTRSIITSTTNGAIAIAPNGTGAVNLQTSTINIGTGSGQPQISTNGAYDMFLTTNFNTNSGSITIQDGANGNIELAPNGTGDVYLTADLVRVGDSGSNATITSNGSGDLILNTNSGTNSGSITIQDGPNTNIILAPHGSGRVQVSGTSSNAGGIEFFEDTDNGSNKALLTAPSALGADITLTLPSTTATLGYLNLPAVGTKTGSYTLATGDVGKYVQVGSGGSITIPDATFAEGDAIVICNNHTAAITITCTITTAYIAGTDADKASVSLATRGVANILFLSSTVCVISGNVS